MIKLNDLHNLSGHIWSVWEKGSCNNFVNSRPFGPLHTRARAHTHTHTHTSRPFDFMEITDTGKAEHVRVKENKPRPASTDSHV